MLASLLKNLLFLAAALPVIVAAPSKSDPLSCVQEYYFAQGDPQREKDSIKAQETIDKILSSIGVRRSIKAIPCSWEKSAVAWMANENEFADVPEGEYIIFNQVFVQNVIGSNRALKVALFAHEVAHILNGDFIGRRSLSRKKKESDADFFAGCIVARLEFSPDELDELVKRIRFEASSQYPNQLESYLLVDEGYGECSRYVRREGLDADRTSQIAAEVISLFGGKDYNLLYDTLLSDWARDTYTRQSLEDIGQKFSKTYGFGEVTSSSRVGFSTLENPPRYPPGLYAVITFDIETTENSFLGTVTIGWQDTAWKAYEYNFNPK